jgi:hypothetical protein
MSATLSSACRAKEPATCPYHGPELRASEYIAAGNYDAALEELKKRDAQKEYHQQVEQFQNDAAANLKMPDNKLEVHVQHCCNIHGCKYGKENCPVETNYRAQAHPCEQCTDTIQAYQEDFGHTQPKAYKKILAVDPAGCGCTECIVGEYVPADQWKWQATDGDIKALLLQRVANHTDVDLTALIEETEFSDDSALRFQKYIKDGPEPVEDYWGT